MSSLKKKLTFILKGELDKILSTLLDETLTNFIDEECFQKLLDILDNKNPKYTKLEAFDCLLKKAKAQTTWSGALKSLMVLHKLVHSIGGDFLDLFAPHKITNISKFPVDKSNLKSLVHSAIVPYYYNYIQKLGYNYSDLHVCFFTAENFSQILEENKLSLLHFLSKVQNILIYLLKLLPLLEASFEQFKNVNLIKQLCYFCLTDCYHYYTYINQVISFMTNEVFNLEEEDAIFLYELYSEHIKMTKQLKQFFNLKNHIPEFSLKEPTFYTLDVNFNRELELHILALRKDTRSPLIKQFTTDFGNKSTTPYTCASEENRTNRMQLTNITELTQIIPQLLPTVNNDKQLFSPPSVRKNVVRNHQNPEIKYYSANNEIEEEKGETFKNRNEAASSNFLKVPSNQMNYLQIPSDSQVMFRNDGIKNDVYNALGTYSPSNSSNPSLTDSYIVG